MKLFDLEKAKAGAVVVDLTNNATGTFLAELKTQSPFKYVFVMSDSKGEEYVETVSRGGRMRSDYDALKMKPTKVVKWVNIYSGQFSGNNMYESAEDARKNASSGCLGQAKLEWEE